MKPLFPQGLPFLNTTPNNHPWKRENNTLIHREKKKRTWHWTCWWDLQDEKRNLNSLFYVTFYFALLSFPHVIWQSYDCAWDRFFIRQDFRYSAFLFEPVVSLFKLFLMGRMSGNFASPSNSYLCPSTKRQHHVEAKAGTTCFQL